MLATIHRASNTDNPENLRNILTAFAKIEEPIIFPVHPRTQQKIGELGFLNPNSKIHNPIFIDPAGYLDMLTLEQDKLILTDSGGIQKEAFLDGCPCITLREGAEWIEETVESGWNLLVGSNQEKIIDGLRHSFPSRNQQPTFLGNGHSAQTIVKILGEHPFYDSTFRRLS